MRYAFSPIFHALLDGWGRFRRVRRTYRDSQNFDRRSWALRARLTKFRWFDPSVDLINNAPRVSGTPEPCGASNAAQANQWSPEACEDCGSSRLGVSEACKDGIDGSGMGVHLGGENFNFEMFLN
ncbi:unnamed protein product [Prunus brigantina]